MARATHTYVIMELSDAAYVEIRAQLEAAEYHQAFHEDSEHGVVMDMHGIAVARRKDDEQPGDHGVGAQRVRKERTGGDATC